MTNVNDFIPSIEEHPSPNYWTPAYVKKQWGHTRKAQFIVIHTTEGVYASDINWLCNPDSQVSAHFYIRQDGKIYVLVHTGNIAWHCATKDSEKTDRPDIWAVWTADNNNWDSIGIECEQPRNQPINEKQMVALVNLCAYLVTTYNITIDRLHIVGHYELKKTKIDPPHFDWENFMIRLAVRIGKKGP